MPHSIRVYKCLRASGFPEGQSLAVASVIEEAKADGTNFDREAIINGLCDAGFTEEQGEALAETVRNCFPAQRFATWFNTTGLKTGLVRAKFGSAIADAFLTALSPSVVTPRTSEPRVRIQHPPTAGRVVMCDFSFLTPPEMQKERRAIVVSQRSAHSPGRCAVVPVSKSPSRAPHPHHHEFPAGQYRFFHPTEPVWAVCDHIYTVGLDRLWVVNIGRRPMPAASISAQDLAIIRGLLGTVLS
jgi:uncharacterized protein YifN (PemK superfamily)